MLLTSMIALIAMDVEAQRRPRTQSTPPTQTSPRAPAPPPVYIPRPPTAAPPPLPVQPPYPTPPPPPPPPPPPGPPPTPARIISGTITNADYPAAAIRAEAEGTTAVRLEISPDGKVSSCAVTGSSGNSALDNTACHLFTTRFRFAPATRSGRPVASTYSQRIIWRLPDDDAPTLIEFGQGRFTQVVTLSPRGVADCEVTLIGTTFGAFDYGQCEELDFVSLADPEALGAGHPPVRLTHTLSLLPQGETLTMPPVPGAPYWEETADLEIAPDGRVTTCTEVSRSGSPPPYANPRFQPLCEDVNYGQQFPVAAGTDVRRARMRSALYVEVLSPRR